MRSSWRSSLPLKDCGAREVDVFRGPRCLTHSLARDAFFRAACRSNTPHKFARLATIDAHSPCVLQLICLLQVGGGGGAESRLLILIMLFTLKGRKRRQRSTEGKKRGMKPGWGKDRADSSNEVEGGSTCAQRRGAGGDVAQRRHRGVAVSGEVRGPGKIERD